MNKVIGNIAIPLLKKGRFRLINNRTISLISYPSIMVRVTLNRIKEKLEELLSEEHYMLFRPKRSTIIHIFNIFISSASVLVTDRKFLCERCEETHPGIRKQSLQNAVADVLHR